MIQRKQTLWLLLAAIAAFLTLIFPFFTGNKMVNNIKTYYELNARFNILLLITTLIVAIACVVIIFLYKDRSKQMMIATATLIASFIIIALYFWQKQIFVDGAISLTSILTFIVPVFIYLAIRGIYADEKLIKSVDRLR